jgi:hypothetical protein
MTTYEKILAKYKIKRGNQYVIEIPNMDSINLAELFAELGFRTGVELGVDRGEYSKILCDSNKDLKLFCVDPWIPDAYEKGTYINEPPEYFNQCFEETKETLKGCNAVLVRKMSADALKDFEDNSLDFVYIDANHDFPNITFDLHNWLKKVKEGGIIAGHDYANFSYRKFNHVKRALDAYARCYRMIPLFVCGTTNVNTRLKRDHFRSWFWVKKEGGLQNV